ncbi:hypothetical protein [Gloeothece verrucosa]|uniref:Uncharacterized protein n=1 Tax=Gloeothece verrucosa (strain PCC 7822) TaxID=497965 RepID=E0U9X1_GLOV7|nr:hypothetical protein [Gloeothece verrucosa]ADN15041.1 conserved hypothetical protein [Gloeothece verrucosa PCC 7822]
MASEKLKPQRDKDPLSESLLQQPIEEKKGLSTTSIGLWVLWVVYVYILLFSPTGQIIGGEPVWAIQPHTIQEALNESTNYFFILPFLNALGINVMIAPLVHPVSQGLFNFAEAWMLMFLPLMLADPAGSKLPKVGLWGLAMFLTNVFLIPYMALRSPSVSDVQLLPHHKGLLERSLGWIAITVAAISVVWTLIAFPDSGNLAQRGQYFLALLSSDRLTIAFVVDIVLFWVFQVILLGAVIPAPHKFRWLRFVPFGGLATWLVI